MIDDVSLDTLLLLCFSILWLLRCVGSILSSFFT